MSGLLFTILGPSGVGKSTITKLLVDRLPDTKLSISYTTRERRPQEKDGDYFWINRQEFEAKIKKGEFLEWAEVYGNLYGTSKLKLEQELEAGNNVVLEIDWQGARNVKQLMPQSVAIALFPPSLKSLEERLRLRSRDSAEEMHKRLSDAKRDMRESLDSDYLLINQDLAVLKKEILAIVIAETKRSLYTRKPIEQLLELS